MRPARYRKKSRRQTFSQSKNTSCDFSERTKMMPKSVFRTNAPTCYSVFYCLKTPRCDRSDEFREKDESKIENQKRSGAVGRRRRKEIGESGQIEKRQSEIEQVQTNRSEKK